MFFRSFIHHRNRKRPSSVDEPGAPAGGQVPLEHVSHASIPTWVPARERVYDVLNRLGLEPRESNAFTDNFYAMLSDEVNRRFDARLEAFCQRMEAESRLTRWVIGIAFGAVTLMLACLAIMQAI